MIAPGDVRPSHPAPNVRDDREPPLLWVQDRRKEATDLGSAQSEIFFQTRLDDPNQIESLDEIAFYARAIFGRADGATSAEMPVVGQIGFARISAVPRRFSLAEHYPAILFQPRQPCASTPTPG